MSEKVLLIGSDAEALEALRKITNALIVSADTIVGDYKAQNQPQPIGLARNPVIRENISKIKLLCDQVKLRIDSFEKHETLKEELLWLRHRLQSEGEKATGSYAVVAQAHLAELIFHLDYTGGRKGKGKNGNRPRRDRRRRQAA